ncbi:MAG: zinc ABC transporter substrate-binding protein [Thermomicrobiales bacterium]|nr:zinc ABC transporter substrate-binding protein [Thermomicrobiales bacterium]MCO5225574.1 zinc ABC transporter substrate-binding protein [Thermomicrobiales bacterium]MCO5227222.1 zinc ABC transporter substrate-binding protein [Thermomicrobiales bacterium]
MPATTSRRYFVGLGAATMLATALSVRQTQKPHTRNDDRPVVTCTVGMITDVAKNIGGDAFSISGLMGPGVDPHLYKPSAGDIVRLGDADLVLYGGLHLEGRMTETFDTLHHSGTTVSIPVSESIPVEQRLTVGEDAWDPHVWFDVSLWNIVAGRIAEGLTETHPGEADAIAEREATYRQKLVDLDEWVFTELARVPEDIRVLVTAHDAFNYFGRRYDVEVVGLQGLSTATEAGAGDVQDLADMLAERQIPAIFVESSIPPSTIKAVQAATKSRGWDVKIGGELFSDAMGEAGTPDGTYIGMIRHNVTTIVEALLGEDAY